MTCHDAREYFSALIDDALDPGERATLDAHLATCDDCRRELSRFRDTVALMRAAGPVRAPAGFVDRVLEAARPVPWPRRLLRGLFLPWPIKLPMEAAALVLVAVGVGLVYRGSPEIQQSARPEQAATAFSRERPNAPPEARAPAPPAETEALQARSGAKEGTREPAAPPRAEPTQGTVPARETSLLKDAKKADTAAPAAPAPMTAARDAEPPKAAESQDRPAAAVGKLEAPASGAERQRSKDNVRATTAQPAEPRTDALKAQRPASAPPALARAFAPPDVSGQLAVSDRELALRSLTELTARLGVVETRRFDGADGPIIELAVPREAYAELNSGLARLGRWQPGQEPSALPATIRLVVRITG